VIEQKEKEINANANAGLSFRRCMRPSIHLDARLQASQSLCKTQRMQIEKMKKMKKKSFPKNRRKMR